MSKGQKYIDEAWTRLLLTRFEEKRESDVFPSLKTFCNGQRFTTSWTSGLQIIRMFKG